MAGRVIRTAAVVAALAGCLGGVVGCGDDIPTKDEFIEQMKAREDSLPSAVYGCTYDAIRKDRKLLDAAMLDPESDNPEDKKAIKAAQSKLVSIFSKCFVDQETTTTTRRPADN